MQTEQPVVLLVEDNAAHAEIVRRQMQRAGKVCRLEHVTDGQEALDYLYRTNNYRDPRRSPRPHLILLDLRMPRIDGLAVLKAIKSDSSLARIPVVVLTTSADRGDIAAAYAGKANSYLVKSVDCAEFSSLLDNLCDYWLTWNRLLF